MHPAAEKSLVVARNWLDTAATKAGRLSPRTLAWGSLGLAAVTFLAVNLFSANALRSFKADLTSEGLYTISPGTRKAVSAIDEPIDLNLYFSKKLGLAAPAFAKSFERVKTLLEQYRSLSGNKIRLTVLDPEPFSDAEDRAVAAGLRGERLNQDGELGYFGLAGTNSTDNESTIAFFTADRERFIEYDVTRLVTQLANPKKRIVGLYSSLPLEGGMDPAQGMRGRPIPPQMILEQIRDSFEIKTLDKDFKDIAKDIDVLMLVQPDGLAAATVYAIDQFALRGGKVLLFVDPVAETNRGQGAMMGMPAPPLKLGDVDTLLKAWGVSYDPTKIAGDLAHARRVQFSGGGRGGTVTEYVAWLGLDKRNFDQKDVLSGGVERVNLASAGILAKAEGATTTLAPIMVTSPQAMQIAADKISTMPDAVGLLRAYKPEGKTLMLAARVSGEIKSAYPDGAPKAAVAADTKPTATALPNALPVPPAPAAVPAAIAATAHLAAGKINAIIVADTDLLNDQFWVDVRTFMGQQVAVPNAHNAAFVVGALENLSGSDALIGLRGRGVTDRPFELVDSIRRNSEQRFREKEQGLTEKLKVVQAELAKIEKGAEGDAVILGDKDRQTIEKFRGEMLSTRRELRDVKLALRQDIDRLDGWLRFLNIAAVPLLIGIGSLLWARRRRTSAT